MTITCTTLPSHAQIDYFFFVFSTKRIRLQESKKTRWLRFYLILPFRNICQTTYFKSNRSRSCHGASDIIKIKSSSGSVNKAEPPMNSEIYRQSPTLTPDLI